MNQNELEPGFLQAFRLFIATRILFWAIIGPAVTLTELLTGTALPAAQSTGIEIVENLTPANTSRMIAVELVLLLLLMLPHVQRRLGRWFVPITLSLAMVPLLIGYYWWPSKNPLQTPFVIFFFLMLVLIAWQFPFRYVLAYVFGLSLYQFSLSASETNLPLGVDVSWLVLQGAMMCLVGYVIVTLVSVQREQREALARAYDQQAAANARLKQYAATVEELTISRERNRLARELHDTLAHSLSAVTVQLEAARSLWELDPEAAHEMLGKADESARTGLTEARRALHALRASPLQEQGLIAALKELAETAADRAGASLELWLPEQSQCKLPPVVEQGIYRIAQEALENIIRHADAGQIALRLEPEEKAVVLCIDDDGLGTEVQDLQSEGAQSKRHLGIRGMEERASFIGGELKITSQAGEGTSVRLRVPL
jgi:signal transduction histidine kinase